MLIFAPDRFKCCNLHDQKHFSLIMESWLLRNVGFYRSFLPFYIIRSILEIVSSGTDYPEQPGKLTTNTRSARDKRWVPEKDTYNVSGSICPRRLKCLCFASILFIFFVFFRSLSENSNWLNLEAQPFSEKEMGANSNRKILLISFIF